MYIDANKLPIREVKPNKIRIRDVGSFLKVGRQDQKYSTGSEKLVAGQMFLFNRGQAKKWKWVGTWPPSPDVPVSRIRTHLLSVYNLF